MESHRRHHRENEDGRYWYAHEYDPVYIGSIDGCESNVPHDKALLRAQDAPYDPSKDPNIQGNPFKTLFVARLNFETTEETLHSVFGKYGVIRRLRLVRHVVTKASRGYAFIEYERERDFEAAYRSTHRMTIDGHVILVEYERERVMEGWKPRRLGGGFGGRKESGQLRFGGRDRPFRQPIRRPHHDQGPR
ncbi:hypothetical protein LEN26_004894 [Aphanomyces euteiches]|nr:hypothetical protein LEN26_019484 [Aphanomyces euteiches]KAH9102198.1 hypothetical protein AeMF1_021193 [Aphanomyces euteiches]KAH9109494.1 hypothetical protein LEN26_014015 [Aphanomyces euteiches]KAH9146878.1 hypothetical protein LEN26_004894 [Aphanomyces euteiches]KAH9187362.1 hypothetical protein AeNC1_010664 [Aphanomyces euteiches]